MASKSMISLRVWPQDLAAWEAAAKAEGMVRSEWIRISLNTMAAKK